MPDFNTPVTQYSDKPLIKVCIKTKEKTLFDDFVYTVTSKNEGGQFDILPEHANYITLINGYIILDSGRQTSRMFELEKGVLYVMSNVVNAYIGI